MAGTGRMSLKTPNLSNQFCVLFSSFLPFYVVLMLLLLAVPPDGEGERE